MAQWRKVVVSGSNAVLNQISVSGNIVPTSDSGVDLGSSTLEFKDLYIDGTAYLDSATITAGTITGITDLVVADGGTGVSTLTDGGILLGSGTDPITATAVLADGEILIGDGTTDPTTLDVGSSTAITTLGTVTTGTWQGTAVADTYVADDLTIDGGSVDNSVIGGSTAATGTFTNLTYTGNLTAGNAAADTHTFTGHITSSGNISSSANLYGTIATATQNSITTATGLTSVGTIGSGTWQGTAVADTYVADNLTISAGTVDNSVIGGTTAAAGTFTTLDCTNGAFALDNLDIDGGTDIGAGLADADLFIVDDGAGGTNRKTVASRIPTYLVDHANLTSLTSLTGVGALNAGSISSGFGAIDNGSSAITTTGTVTAGTLSVTGNASIAGNLDVDGTVTTVDSTNLVVKDKFILVNSGSASGDGGVVVQTATDKSGTALFYDDSNSRWGLTKADDTAHDATTGTPRQWISSVSSSAGDPTSTPSDFGTTNQYFGMMYVNSTDGSVWIYS